MYLTVQGQEDADILQDDLNVLQEWEKAEGVLQNLKKERKKALHLHKNV